jgi:hypothetical protein
MLNFVCLKLMFKPDVSVESGIFRHIHLCFSGRVNLAPSNFYWYICRLGFNKAGPMIILCGAFGGLKSP